jgi:hypothetical protein
VRFRYGQQVAAENERAGMARKQPNADLEAIEKERVQNLTKLEADANLELQKLYQQRFLSLRDAFSGALEGMLDNLGDWRKALANFFKTFLKAEIQANEARGGGLAGLFGGGRGGRGGVFGGMARGAAGAMPEAVTPPGFMSFPSSLGSSVEIASQLLGPADGSRGVYGLPNRPAFGGGQWSGESQPAKRTPTGPDWGDIAGKGMAFAGIGMQALEGQGGPVVGGMQGAVEGFEAAGPWGALAGGVIGLIGGIFGGKKHRKPKEDEIKLPDTKDIRWAEASMMPQSAFFGGRGGGMGASGGGGTTNLALHPGSVVINMPNARGEATDFFAAGQQIGAGIADGVSSRSSLAMSLRNEAARGSNGNY